MATTPTTLSPSKIESIIKGGGTYISNHIKKLSDLELRKSESLFKRLNAKCQFYIKQSADLMAAAPFNYGTWKATTRKANHYSDKLFIVQRKLHGHHIYCVLEKITEEELTALIDNGLRL